MFDQSVFEAPGVKSHMKRAAGTPPTETQTAQNETDMNSPLRVRKPVGDKNGDLQGLKGSRGHKLPSQCGSYSVLTNESDQSLTARS